MKHRLLSLFSLLFLLGVPASAQVRLTLDANTVIRANALTAANSNTLIDGLNSSATHRLGASLLGSGTASNTTYLRGDGTWVTVATSGGTVASVGLTLPNIFAVTGSPVTTSGTLAATFVNQNANAVLAGPSSGSAAAPTFRALTAGDAALVPTVVKTAAYTAAANDLVPVDVTSGNVTITLPNAPADKSQIEVKLIAPTSPTNTVTVQLQGSDVLNIAAGATSATIKLKDQWAVFQYAASGAIWYVRSSAPLSQLDLRYPQLANLGSDFAGPSPMTADLVAEYRFAEGTGRSIASRGAPRSVNLFQLPEGGFNAGSPFWTKSGSVTITDGYGLDPTGGSNASRWLAAGGANTYISQAPTFASGAVLTMSLYVASNTGAAQKMRTYYNNAFSSDITIPATGWTRITATFTASGANLQLLPIVTDAAAEAQDLLIYGAQLEPGAVATNYQPNSKALAFYGAPAWTATGLDLSGSGTRYAIAPNLNLSFPGVSLYAVVKWPTANTESNANAVGLLSDASSTKFGLYARNGATGPNFVFSSTSLNASYSNLKDGNYHLVSAIYDGANLRMFIDDAEVANLAGVIAPVASSLLLVGNLLPTGTTYVFPGEISYASVYNTGHSSAQIARQFIAIRALMAEKGVALSGLSKFVAFEGDSITSGQGGTTIYPITALAAITPSVNGRNHSVAGSQITDMNSRAAAVDANVKSTRTRNVLSVLIGHNDMIAGGQSAATFVATLKTYCLARRAAGWNRIVLGTVLPSTVSGFNSLRNAANTLIRADTSFYDQLCDYDTNSIIGADAAAANTTYYSDGTHPTTAGYNLMAPINQAAITAALL